MLHHGLSHHMQKCLSEGAKVIAMDINYVKLKELKEENEAFMLDTLDVTDGQKVKRVMEKYEDINVLFNYVG